jgi:hypothetical protein
LSEEIESLTLPFQIGNRKKEEDTTKRQKNENKNEYQSSKSMWHEDVKK